MSCLDRNGRRCNIGDTVLLPMTVLDTDADQLTLRPLWPGFARGTFTAGSNQVYRELTEATDRPADGAIGEASMAGGQGMADPRAVPHSGPAGG